MTPAPLEVGAHAALDAVLSQADVDALIGLAGSGLTPNDAAQMLICALWSRLLGVHLPGRGTNYLKQETRFLAPAPLHAKLTARVTITRLRPDKGLVDLETTCSDADGVLIGVGRALVQARDTGRMPQP